MSIVNNISKRKYFVWLVIAIVAVVSVAMSLVLFLNDEQGLEKNAFNANGSDPEIALAATYHTLTTTNYNDYDIFQIDSVAAFDAFLCYQNLGYKFTNKTLYLTTDLDLTNYYPAGGEGLKDICAFEGTFNGLYHTIRNAGQGTVYTQMAAYTDGKVKFNHNRSSYTLNKAYYDSLDRTYNPADTNLSETIVYDTGYPDPLITMANYGEIKNLTADSSCVLYYDENTHGSRTAFATFAMNNEPSGLLQNCITKAIVWNRCPRSRSLDRTCAPLIVHNSGIMDSCVSYAVVVCGELSAQDHAIACGAIRSLSKNALMINSIFFTKVYGYHMNRAYRDNPQGATDYSAVVNCILWIPDEDCVGFSGGSYDSGYHMGAHVLSYNVLERNALAGSSALAADDETNPYGFTSAYHYCSTSEGYYEDSSAFGLRASTYGNTYYNSSSGNYNYNNICALLNANIGTGAGQLDSVKGIKLKKFRYNSSITKEGNGFELVTDDAPEIYDSSWSGYIAENGKTTISCDALSVAGLTPFTYSLDNISYQSEDSFEITEPGAYTIYVKDRENNISSTNVYVARDYVYTDFEFTSLGNNEYSFCITGSHMALLGATYTIPSTYNGGSVVTVGEGCFKGSSVSRINIPNTIRKIENEAFAECANITTITIPASVSSIGSKVFANDTGLTEIIVNNGNPHYFAIDGNLYRDSITKIVPISSTFTTATNYETMAGQTLVYYCQGKTSSSFVIPEGTKYIDRYAFYFPKSLTSITIPSTLVDTMDRAFYYCENVSEYFVTTGGQTKNPAGYFAYNGDLYKTATYNYVFNSRDIDNHIANNKTSITLTRLVQYAIAKTDDYYETPHYSDGGEGFFDCEVVDTYAFAGALNLKSIRFSDPIISVGRNSTSSCNNLIEVFLPTDIKKENELGAFLQYQMSSVFQFAFPYTNFETYTTFTGYGEARWSGQAFYNDNEYGFASTNNTAVFYTYGYKTYQWLTTKVTNTTGAGHSNVMYFPANSFGIASINQVVVLTNPDLAETFNSDGILVAKEYVDDTVAKPVYAFDVDNNTIYIAEDLTKARALFGSAGESYYASPMQDNLHFLCYKDSANKEVRAVLSNDNYPVKGANTAVYIKVLNTSYTGYEFVEMPNSADSYAILASGGKGSVGFFNVPEIYSGYNVTKIGDSAFEGASGLEEVRLTSYITSIGKNAFKGTGLVYIAIPESVTTIGEGAFANSDGSQNSTIVLYIENTDLVQAIAANPSYYGIADMNQVNGVRGVYSPVYDQNGIFLGYELTQASSSAAGIYEVESTYKNEIVMQIGQNAFRGNRNITQIILPETIEYIKDGAFENCSSLEYINLGSSQGTMSQGQIDNIPVAYKVLEIGQNAFAGTSHLDSITLPSSVKSIGKSIFDNSGITEILNLENTVITSIPSKAFYQCSNLEAISLSNLITTINDDAFAGCSSITTLVIPDSVSSIGRRALATMLSLEDLTIPFIGNNSTTTSGSIGYLFGGVSYTDNASVVPTSLTDLTISGVGYTLVIPSYAFYQASHIENITLSTSVLTIGSNSFAECSSLETINIPNSITSIGEKAFAMDVSLTQMIIPTSVATIGSNILYGCENIDSLTLPYLGPTPDKDFTGKASETIGYTFGGDSNQTTGNNAKMYTVNYQPDSTEVVTDITIKYSMVLPKSLLFVTITGISNTASATDIPNYAFYGASSVVSFNIPETINTVGAYAFAYTSGVNSLTGLDVGTRTTSGNVVTDTFKSNIKKIGIGAFASNYTDLNTTQNVAKSAEKNATKLVIPQTIEYIGYGAFYGWNNLVEVTVPFTGQKDEEGSLGSAVSEATGYTTKNKHSARYTGAEYGFSFAWIFGFTVNESHGSSTYIDVQSYSSGAEYTYFWMPSDLTKVTINAKVGSYAATSVKAGAFQYCDQLIDIIFPLTITTIHEYALWGAGLTTLVGTNLAEVDSNDNNWLKLSSNITRIDDGALACFRYDSSNGTRVSTILDTNLYIPNSVTSRGVNVLASWTRLEKISVPFAGRTTNDNFNFDSYFAAYDALMEDSTAQNAHANSLNTSTGNITQAGIKYYIYDALEEVYVRGGYVAAETFRGATGLKKLYLMDSTQIVGTRQFEECSGLVEIRLPNTLLTIQGSMFKNCTALEEVIIPYSVKTIESNAFALSTGKTSALETVIFDVNTSDNNSLAIETISQNAFPNSKIKRLDTITNIENNTSKINIPDGVSYIGDNAFSSTYAQATEIVLPTSLLYIGNGAFAGFPALTTLTVPYLGNSIHEEMSFSDDLLIQSYFEDRSVLHAILGGVQSDDYYKATYQYRVITSQGNNGAAVGYSYIPKTLTTVTILGGVIDYYSLANLTSLTTVTLPTNTKGIGDFAFYNTTSLQTVNNTSNLEAICGAAFQKSGLESFNFGNKLEYVYGGAFMNSGLKTLDFTNATSLRFIGTNAFRITDKEGILNQSLALPASIETIGLDAFADMLYLTSITVPIADIQYSTVFGNMSAQKVSEYNSTMTSATYSLANVGNSRSRNVYNNISSATLIAGTAGTQIPDYMLFALQLSSIDFGPATSIGSYALAGNEAMVTLEIPSAVTSIGEGAIYGMKNLNSLKVHYVGASKNAANGTRESHLGYIFGKGTVNAAGYYKTGHYLNNGVLTAYTDGQYFIPNSLQYLTVAGDDPSNLVDIKDCAFTGLDLVTLTLENVGQIGVNTFYAEIDTIVCLSALTFATSGDIGRVQNVLINYPYSEDPEDLAFYATFVDHTNIAQVRYPQNIITIDDATATAINAYASVKQNVYVLKYSYDYDINDTYLDSEVGVYLYNFREVERVVLQPNIFVSDLNGQQITANNTENHAYLDAPATGNIGAISGVMVHFNVNTEKISITIPEHTSIVYEELISKGFVYENLDGKFSSPAEIAQYITIKVYEGEHEIDMTSGDLDGLNIEFVSLLKYGSTENYYVRGTDYVVYDKEDNALDDEETAPSHITFSNIDISVEVRGQENIIYDGAKHTVSIIYPEGFNASHMNYVYQVKKNSGNYETYQTLPEFYNVGTYYYKITISGAGYNEITKEAVVSILKRTIVVTIDPNQGKVYGDEDPEITYKAVYADNNETIGTSVLMGSISRQSGNNSGLYYYVSNLSLINSANYTLTYGEVYGGTGDGYTDNQFKIAKANLGNKTYVTVDMEGNDFGYTGSAIIPGIVVTFAPTGENIETLVQQGYEVGNEIADYRIVCYNNLNVGTATLAIIATSEGNFYGAQEIEYNIVQRDITGCTTITLEHASLAYNGSAVGNNIVSAVVTIGQGSYTLTSADYTISFSNNIEVGNGATIILTGTGNFTGTASTTYTIAARDLTNDELLSVATISNQYYIAQAIEPQLTLHFDSTLLVDGTDYDVAYSNNVTVGTATATVTFKGNFTGSTSTTFTIVPAKSSTVIFSALSEIPYTGRTTSVNIRTFTVAGTSIVADTTDYSISYTTQDRINLGYVRYTVTGANNLAGYKYSGYYKIVSTSIANAEITVDYLTHPGNYIYSGSAITPEFTVTYYSNPDDHTNGDVLTYGTDYYYEISNNINAGNEALITVYGLGTFASEGVSITEYFTITPQTLSASNVTYTDSIVYVGDVSPDLGFIVQNAAGATLTIGTDYTVTYPETYDVTGTNEYYTATITGSGNYTGTIQKNYTVTTYTLSTNDSIRGTTKGYNGTQHTPDIVIVDANGNTLEQDTDFTVAYVFGSDGTSVGTQYVNVTGIGNYTGELKNITFEIVNTTIDESAVSISGDTFVYTGSEITPTVTVVYGGRTLIVNEDYLVEYSNNTNVGTATIDVTFLTYAGNAQKTFTITPYELSQSDVYNFIQNYDYSGAVPEFVLEIRDSNGNTLIKNSQYVLAADVAYVPGEYTLTVSGLYDEINNANANYKGSIELQYTINSLGTQENPATLTIVDTKANAGDSYIYTSNAVPVLLNVSYGSLNFTSSEYTITYFADSDYQTELVQTPVESGRYYYRVTVNTNIVKGIATGAYTIERRDINDTNLTLTVSTAQSRVYTGNEIRPAIIFSSTYGTVTYDIEYMNNIENGTATIMVTGTGNFDGTRITTFEVEKINIESNNTTIALSKTSSTYDHLHPETNLPNVVINGTSVVGCESTENYEITIKDSSNNEYTASTFPGDADTYTIKVVGTNNAMGTKQFTYTINPSTSWKWSFVTDRTGEDKEWTRSWHNGAVSVTDHVYKLIYTGSIQTFDEFVVTSYDGAVTLVRDVDYTLTYEVSVNATMEQQHLLITMIGNYSGDSDHYPRAAGFAYYDWYKAYYCIVADEDIEEGDVYFEYSKEEYNYTGRGVEVEVQVYYNMNPLPDDITITYYSDAAYLNEVATPVEVGKHYFKITTAGTNIKQTILYGDYTISPASLNRQGIYIELSPRVFTYTGTFPAFKKLVVTDVYSDHTNTLVQGVDYEVSIENDDYSVCGENEDRMVTIEGIGNYKDIAYARFQIVALDMDAQDVETHISVANVDYNPSAAYKNLPVITIEDVEFVYPYNQSSDFKFTFTYLGQEYTPAQFAELNALDIVLGTYDVKIEANNNNGNVSGSYESTWTIGKYTLVEENVSDSYVGSYVFTTRAMTFADLEIVYDGVTLIRGTDYTLTTLSSIYYGTGKSVRVAGIGKYQGTIDLEYEITKLDLSNTSTVATITDLNNGVYTYTSVANPVNISVEYEDYLAVAADYTLTYYSDGTYNTVIDTPVEAGTYWYAILVDTDSIKIKGNGHYTISPRDINDIQVSVAEPEVIADRIYSASIKTPEVTFATTYGTLVKNTDYTLTYPEGTLNIYASDIAEVTITGQGNYTGTTTLYFTIEKLDLSSVGSSVSASVSQNVLPFSATNGRYNLPVVTINGIVLDFSDENYNNPEFEVTITKGTTNYTLEEFPGSVGSYQMTIKGQKVGLRENVKENSEYIVLFSISSSEITRAGNFREQDYVGTYTYSNSHPAFNDIALYNGSVALVRDEDYEIIPDNLYTVGNYTLTIQGINNYSGSFTLNYSITKLDLTNTATEATIEDLTAKYIYTSSAIPANIQVSYIGYVCNTNEYTITYYSDATRTEEIDTPVNVGTYYYRVAVDTGSMAINGSGSYVITPRNIAGSTTDGYTAMSIFVANSLTQYERVYNGNAINPKINCVDARWGTFVENTDYTLSYPNDGTNVNAGTGSVTVTGQGNFIGEVTLNFTISVLDVSSAILTSAVRYITPTQSQYKAAEPTTNLPVIYINQFELNVYDYIVNDQFVNDSEFNITLLKNDVEVENFDGAVGTYTIRLEGGANSSANTAGSIDFTFTIAQRRVQSDFVTNTYVGSYAYNTEIPTFDDLALEFEGIALVKDEDYTITPSNETDAGEYKLTITGIGQYTDSFEIDYVITKITNATLTIEGINEIVYTYTSQALPMVEDVQWQYGTITASDYTVEYYSDYTYATLMDSVPVDVNLYYFVVNVDLNNVSGRISGYYDIEARDLSNIHVTAVAENPTYTGHSVYPTVTFDNIYGTITENVDYTLTYNSNTVNAGVVKATLTGKGNFKGSINISYVIAALDLSTATIIPEFSQRAYNPAGNNYPGFTIMVGGSATDINPYSSAEFNVSFEDQTTGATYTKSTFQGGVGTYKVTLTGATRNVTGTYSRNFTITGLSLTADMVITYQEEYTFTGTTPNFDITIGYADGNNNVVALTNGVDYQVEGQVGDTVFASSTYLDNNELKYSRDKTMVITGLGNYAGYIEKSYSITAATDPAQYDSSQVSLTPADRTYTYNGNAQAPEFAVYYGDVELVGENATLRYFTSETHEANTEIIGTPANVGTYYYIATVGGKNIAATELSGYYTIDKATVVVAIKANQGYSSAYGSVIMDLSDAYTVVEGTIYNNEITINVTTLATPTSPVGTYAMSAEAVETVQNSGLAENYNITVQETEETYAITKKEIDITVSAKDKAVSLGVAFTPSLEISSEGFVGDDSTDDLIVDPESVTYTYEGINDTIYVGSTTVPSASGTYQITVAIAQVDNSYPIESANYVVNNVSYGAAGTLTIAAAQSISIKDDAEANFIECVKSGKKYVYNTSKTHGEYDANDLAVIEISKAGQKIQAVLDMLEIDINNIKVYDTKGALVAASKYNSSKTVVGSGYKIQLVSGDAVLDEIMICLRGDVNGDGKINITDVNTLYNAIVDSSVGSYSKCLTYAADYSKDGKANITDVNSIYNKLV